MTAPRLEAGSGAAVDRVTRTMSLALGVGALVFAALTAAAFVRQLPEYVPGWAWAAAASMLLPLLAAAVLSPAAPPRVLRVLAGVAATGHLVALATLLPALPDGHVDGSLGAPWILQVSVMGCAAAAVAWRPAIAWSAVGVSTVLHLVDRGMASEYPIPDLAVLDALHTLLFDAMFVAVALATRRAGSRLDAVADLAARETRAVAVRDARERERTRVEALVHDHVLVALLASARGTVRAAVEARAALASLDEAATPEDDGPVPGRAWVWRVQALATDLVPTARFSHEIDGETTLPAEPAGAAVAATAEALRNCLRHAGPAARAVHARVDARGFEVTVLDDGFGFDPAQVGSARLGVAIGILDRMRSIPGGRAAIASRPGVGTRVVIAWDAP